jgi:uncharacterized membrane protein
MGAIMPESGAKSDGGRSGFARRCTTIGPLENRVSAAAGGSVSEPGKPADTRLVIGPNASLSDRQALGFFAGMCGVCLTIAAVFAGLGLWPVLPFAGLELAALAAALWVVVQRNRYREVLEFAGERLRVEFGITGEGARARCEWPRSGTRVWLERGPHGNSPTRLVLACGTAQLSIGACLTDAERAGLMKRLKELIHPAWTHAGSPDATRRVVGPGA